MTREIGADSWRVAAAEALTPADESDPLRWQERLADMYVTDVGATHGALWRRAAELLVRYGAPRVFSSGPMEVHPRGAALSTGVMAIGEVQERQGVFATEAVRLSVANTRLHYDQLPMKEIGRDIKAGGDDGYERASRRLAEFPDLTAMRLDVFMLATEENALRNPRDTRGRIKEAVAPTKYVHDMTLSTSYGYTDDDELRRHLRRKPEVALWGVPLEVFESGTGFIRINRPQVPTLELAKNAPLEACHQAVKDALQRVHDEQPHAAEMLGMLMAVTEPVRSVLGKMAVVKFADDV